MALEDLISQFNASILVASEWGSLALLPSTNQDLGLVAKCAAEARSNLSVATQVKIDLESLLIEPEPNLSVAINKGETVSTLDCLKAELNSTQSADQKANVELRAATTNVELANKLVEALLANIGDVVKLPTINGNSPSITINDQPSSKTNPGSGWKAIAIAPSKSGTLLERLVAWHTCTAA
jgi:hypothetical protein